MTFQEILESKHSKENTLTILAEIDKDPSKVEELMELFFHENRILCQRASWPVGYLGERNSDLILPYFDKMLKNLDAPKHDAVVRNTLRTWREMTIPETFEGEVFEKCFEYLASPNYATAIRAFAMVIATKIAKKYPELAYELIPTIEEIAPYCSSGLKNCCKNQLIELRKLSLN